MTEFTTLFAAAAVMTTLPALATIVPVFSAFSVRGVEPLATARCSRPSP